MPQRVTLVSWGKVLEVGVRLLLGQDRQLRVVRSPVELAKGVPPADVIVVDVPGRDRHAVCEQVRRHHGGRLLVLLNPGESGHDLPPHPNQTLLTRPFFVYELSAALAGSGPARPTPTPEDQPPPVPPRTALARRVRSRLGGWGGVVAQLVRQLMSSWRERRLVGVSAISLTAALLGVVAFVLTTQGAGCGHSCDELTGADLTPSSTTAVTTTRQDTTATGAGLVGPATTDSSVVPATDGSSRAEATTSSRPGTASTTAGSSATSSPTPPPDSTQPPPTAAPTTAPTTTGPEPSTTTTATTTKTTRPRPPGHS